MRSKPTGVFLAAGLLLTFGRAIAQNAPAPAPEGPKTGPATVAKHWSKNKYPESIPEGAAYHIVEKGDTLWDISDAYLGTPWVWPSIWKDNTAEVANPHHIYPGERIWISPYEMRKVSDTEAAEMIARTPASEPQAPDRAGAT